MLDANPPHLTFVMQRGECNYPLNWENPKALQSKKRLQAKSGFKPAMLNLN